MKGQHTAVVRTAFAVLIGVTAFSIQADDARLEPTTLMDLPADARKGFEILLSVPMAGTTLKKGDIDRLYTVWEPEEKAKAEAASPDERRKMTFARYGLIPRNDGSGLPLGYTEGPNESLVTNCFSCHGGKVAGTTVPGLGNSHTDLTALMTDVAKLARLERGLDPSVVKDLKAPYNTPFNITKGSTNATMFSLVLGAMRDPDLNQTTPRNPGPLTHNSMDAPPWWIFKKKTMIYCDAFAPPSTRTLMQFSMSPGISGEQIRGFEDEFGYIRSFIENVKPPRYPFPINEKLAAEGREHFEMTCARCHGTYGPDGKFPNKVIPLAEIGTDGARFVAVPKESREQYNQTWFADYGKHPVNLTSVGYLAQPLDGIWASAPYFHNGSVPTIEDVFNPASRPAVWKRTEDGYDQRKIGLEVEVTDRVPDGLNNRASRMYYDTSKFSQGNGGHLYPDQELNAEEKLAVMEYLKTL